MGGWLLPGGVGIGVRGAEGGGIGGVAEEVGEGLLPDGEVVLLDDLGPAEAAGEGLDLGMRQREQWAMSKARVG
ncbi:unnamed protein product [Spirodela intermedia]|uniref:Uncharacterized protein n=1 Tax=Spirodela intermedia TaxID=51605 RepID=A0A7I8K645_SPIIN|nr:unnamed protein product [Spirodela intermedia]